MCRRRGHSPRKGRKKKGKDLNAARRERGVFIEATCSNRKCFAVDLIPRETTNFRKDKRRRSNNQGAAGGEGKHSRSRTHKNKIRRVLLPANGEKRDKQKRTG